MAERIFHCKKCEHRHVRVRYCAKRDEESKALLDEWLSCKCERCSYLWNEPISLEKSDAEEVRNS